MVTNTATITATVMSERDDGALSPRALVRILSWFTPALPTGAFAYSGGLESAFAEGLIETVDDLGAWIGYSMHNGTAWNDAVICAAAWRSDGDLQGLCDLARALSAGKERHDETVTLGDAFVDAVSPWTPKLRGEVGRECPLPVAVGRAAHDAGLPLAHCLNALLQNYVSNQIQAALRMGRFGQAQGTQILAALESDIGEVAARALNASLDDIGGSTLMSDLLSLSHEQLEPRIFRS